MTREELEEYPYICNRIKQLDKKIENEDNREIEIVRGKVKGSMREHPYIETHVSVEMYEPKESDKSIKRILMYKHERDKLLKRKEAIEEYIDSIKDLQIRIIFQYAFIERKKQREIADELHLDRSRISRKISDYLKNAHKAQG